MGKFVGHLLPGTVFVVNALWMTFCTFRSFYTTRRKRKSFVTSTYFPTGCCCSARTFPCDAAMRVIILASGGLVEFIQAQQDTKAHDRYRQYQHASMYFFFGLFSVFEILHHCKLPIPENTHYLMLNLAFAMQGLLFKFHLHGRSPLDSCVHVLLIYVLVVSVLASSIEMKMRHSLLASLFRIYTMFLQGTWLWQISFTLYNPVLASWDPEDDSLVMLAVVVFTCHCGAALLVMCFIGAVVCKCYNTECLNSDAERPLILYKAKNNDSFSNEVS